MWDILENVPDGYQKLVRQKMLGLINQNYYEFHNPNELSKSYSNAIATVLVHNANSFKDDLADWESFYRVGMVIRSRRHQRATDLILLKNPHSFNMRGMWKHIN